MKNSIIIICLILIYSCSKNSKLPEANFSFKIDGSDEAPSKINFINTSTKADYYLWEFGDTQISNSDSPEHVFHQPGNFHVKLKAYNDEGSTECTKSILVKGKAYTIFNGSSYKLYNVISFDNLKDGFYRHGFIDIEDYSFPFNTDLSSVSLGFKNEFGNAFIVAEPYNIEENKTTKLGIYDFTDVYYVGNKKNKIKLSLSEAIKFNFN